MNIKTIGVIIVLSILCCKTALAAPIVYVGSMSKSDIDYVVSTGEEFRVDVFIANTDAFPAGTGIDNFSFRLDINPEGLDVNDAAVLDAQLGSWYAPGNAIPGQTSAALSAMYDTGAQYPTIHALYSPFMLDPPFLTDGVLLSFNMIAPSNIGSWTLNLTELAFGQGSAPFTVGSVDGKVTAQVNAVPIPSTILLLSGLLGVLGFRKRRFFTSKPS
jgi:hypothetical protein